jgi:hypothetical protein
MCARTLFFLLAAGIHHQKLAGSIDKAPERLVAVSDVHGAFDDLCLILKRRAFRMTRTVGSEEAPRLFKRATSSIAVPRDARLWI